MRTSLVTGGNRGIGFEICRALRAAGLEVVLGARDLDVANRAAETIGGAVRPLRLDVSDPASILHAASELHEEGVAIDVLVNNAGVLWREDFLTPDETSWDATMAVNLMGPVRMIRAFAPEMAARGYGRIVNLSSGWGSFAQGLGPAAYAVSKAALNAATVTAARDIGPAVKVNAMCPGWVATDMGGAEAPRKPSEPAETAVWLATLEDDGPTGGFFRDKKEIPW